MEASLTGLSGMLFVCFLLSVLWLSSLRGVRGCGGSFENEKKQTNAQGRRCSGAVEVSPQKKR